MAPKFIFIRHAEAEHNVKYREIGDDAFTNPDYEDAVLTKKGIEQARETAQKLQDLKIFDLWSSPLTRTIQTSEELFEELTIHTMYLHDNLLERQGGGHICNKRASKDILKEKHFCFDTEFLPDSPPEWKDRENQVALAQRMRMLVLQLADLYKNLSDDFHILIISHKDAICALTGYSLLNAEFVVMSLDEIPKGLELKPL